MNALENRSVLVTGGSRGIGAAVALRLAEAGADVALTHVSDEAAATQVEEIADTVVHLAGRAAGS